MNVVHPYTKIELAHALQAIRDKAVFSKKDLEEWYEQASEIHKRIAVTKESDIGKIPEFIWHYLSDADIRMKDSRYLEIQDKGIKEIIALLSKG